jgi:uncharacterized protein (TIGR02284 family)
METNDHTVKVLNSLIETTIDSANGYRHAAETVEDPQLRSMFEQRASQRTEITSELQREVRSFGGEPKEDQSALGQLHNKFVDIKSSVTGHSDKAVIDEVERGEDFIKGKFESAFNGSDLPQQARDMVSRAYGAIKADHDDISRLKREMH